MATLSALAPTLLLIVAQGDSRRMSLLQWAFMSLGWFYTLLFLVVGLGLFLGAVVVVIAARRPAVIAAYLPFLALPLLLGVWATAEGMIRSWAVIAYSTTTPSPSEMAQGYSTALFSILAGVMATMPALMVTSIGLFLRTMLHGGREAK